MDEIRMLAAPASNGDGAPEVEVTKEMIEDGAKALDHLLWKRDPFAKQVPLSDIRQAVEQVYRAMALATRK